MTQALITAPSIHLPIEYKPASPSADGQDILISNKQKDAALEKIERSAQEFEALVLSQLLAPIFASVEKSELTGGSSKNDAFQSMIQEEYAKSIAARGGIGIADQVKTSLLAIQANQSTHS